MDASELWIAILDASRDGDRKRVAELLDLGAEPDSPYILSGYTPLHNAIAARDAEMVALLLDHGADIEHCNNTVGQSPLLTAVLVGSTGIVQLLLDRGADPQLSDKDDESVADVARTEGFPEIAALLER